MIPQGWSENVSWLREPCHGCSGNTPNCGIKN